MPLLGQFISVAFTFFVLLMSASLLVPLELRIRFYHYHNDQHLSVEIRSLGGHVYHKVVFPTLDYHTVGQTTLLRGTIQTIAWPHSRATPPREFEISDTLAGIKSKAMELFHQWREHRRLFLLILKHTHVTELNWATQLGLADAALTGLASGGLWMIKSSLVSVVGHYAHLDRAPQLRVMPSFNRRCYATRMDCIVRLHLGDAMVVGLLLGKNLLWGWARARTTSD